MLVVIHGEKVVNILTKDEFLRIKSSDTMVIYGCGWSLNEISDNREHKLQTFDSIAFNEFYKGKIPVTHYLIRENNNTPNRSAPGETLDDFYEAMNGQYSGTTKIVLSNVHGEYKHSENLDKIPGDGIVIRDFKGSIDVDCDIFEKGCCHWKMTLTNAIHIAKYMRYDRIIFSGVDLYDSRYFWLPKNERRYTVKMKSKQVDDMHATAKNAVYLVQRVKMKAFVENPKSMLSQVLKVWDGT